MIPTRYESGHTSAAFAAEHRAVQRQAAELASREHLDPRDPDALDDEERETLNQLRGWEP